MNIIHLEDEPWDSGIAHYALTLAVEQARQGHRVEFWGLSGSSVLKDAESRGLKTRGWAAIGAWLSIMTLRRDMAAFGAEVVNAHTGASHVLALAVAPAKAAVIRTRGDARMPKAGFLARLAASRTTTLIAANTELQARLEESFPRSRVRLVCPGVPGPEAVAPMPSAPCVGMIARFDPVKGHDTLLDAAEILKPEVSGLQVLCAGDGADLGRLRGRLQPL
ncbi:MAG: glycosyltransferase, partial [Elusimicrobiota bacterium]